MDFEIRFADVIIKVATYISDIKALASLIDHIYLLIIQSTQSEQSMHKVLSYQNPLGSGLKLASLATKRGGYSDEAV